MMPEVEGRQAKRKEKVALLQANQKASVIEVMNSSAGRMFIGRILETTGYMTPSFTGSSETFFREGRRSVGLQLFNELMEICPESFWLMVKEMKQPKEAVNG